MKERIVLDSLWSAEFTLLHGRGFAERGDVYNTVGCLTRTAASLTQVLFALNETYFIRDKQVMQVIAGFPLVPGGYVEQVTGILAHPGSRTDELAAGAVEHMRALPGKFGGEPYQAATLQRISLSFSVIRIQFFHNPK